MSTERTRPSTFWWGECVPAHSRNKYSVSIPDRVVIAIRPARTGVRHRTAKSSYGEQRAGARSCDICVINCTHAANNQEWPNLLISVWGVQEWMWSCGLWATASCINVHAGTGFMFPVRGTRGHSTSLSGMAQNTNLLEGGHTLTSPKGVRPCPLSTLDRMVVAHLVFW